MAFMTSPVTMRGVGAAALAALGVLSPAPGDAGGFLGVRGGKLLDGAGNPVVLRGFNVEFKDFKETLGEAEVRAIAATGANSIRLNLDHRDLEAAPFVHREEGLALLDTVLDWCEKHGLLVVLDLHLAPGRQNPHDFVVHRERTFHFWEDSQFQERFFSLWEALAGRCAGRGVVAGYDLLNEGMPPTLEDYRRVMNAAAARIRARDANHVLVVEDAILPDGTKELVLIVVHILRKSRQPITNCVAEIDADRADTDPKVFTRIHVHFIISGKGLDPRRVEQAVTLSAEKYCSASIMLGKVAEVTHDFVILEA